MRKKNGKIIYSRRSDVRGAHPPSLRAVGSTEPEAGAGCGALAATDFHPLSEPLAC